MATVRSMNASMEDSRPIQDQLHDHLDAYFSSLDMEWRAPLTFDMHVGMSCAISNETTPVDIMAFIDRQPDAAMVSGQFAYFSRTKFPPATCEEMLSKDNTTLASLQNHLYEAA